MTFVSRRSVALFWLLVLHLAALLAGALSPFDPAEQYRDAPFQPPSAWVESDTSHWHFVLGSDALGRDQLSRLLFGLRISLGSGLVAAMLALSLGTFAGTVSGWVGGWLDTVFMRCTELFVSLPWFYLLLAVRAALPLDISPAQVVFVLVLFAGAIGWARPARLVRGLVLSAKEREFVKVARAFGGHTPYLLTKHIVPQLTPLLKTQAMVLIPKYILAEATLSLLGLGIAEPVPSLGGLLANLQQYHVLVSYWWMYLPALVMISILAAWHALSHS